MYTADSAVPKEDWEIHPLVTERFPKCREFSAQCLREILPVGQVPRVIWALYLCLWWAIGQLGNAREKTLNFLRCSLMTRKWFCIFLRRPGHIILLGCLSNGKFPKIWYVECRKLNQYHCQRHHRDRDMIAYRQDSLARLFGINRVGSKKTVNTSKSWWALGGWISGKSVLICSEEFGNDQNQNTSGSKKLMTFYKCRFCFFTLKILLQPLMYPGTVENTNFLVTMGQFDLSAQTLPWEANLVSTDVSFWSGQGVNTWAKLQGGFLQNQKFK